MNMPMQRLALLAIVLATLPTPSAWAEQNRLLPFWGQPYPSGYAWSVDEIDQSPFVPCRSYRSYDHAERRVAPDARCRVVLHARD